jgi:hypothetical protein
MRPPHLRAGFGLRAIAGAAVADHQELHGVLADWRLHVDGGSDRRGGRLGSGLLPGNCLRDRGKRKQAPENGNDTNRWLRHDRFASARNGGHHVPQDVDD